MERLFNKLVFRIIVSVVVGIPLTALALIAGAHGIVLGYGGLVKCDFLPLIFGIITIVGFIGIAGAWRRLLKPTNLITEHERYVIRVMLFCGFVSSFGMTVLSLYSEGMTEISLFLIMLSLGGIAFIMGTPKNAL